MFSDKFLSSNKFINENEFITEYAMAYVESLKVAKGIPDNEIKASVYDFIENMFDEKTEDEIKLMKSAFWSTLRNPNINFKEKCDWYLLMSKMNNDQLHRLYTTNFMEKSKLEEIDNSYKDTSSVKTKLF